MFQHQIISSYIIQSEIDNQKFTVDKKIIESSALLKNICDITDVTAPIIIRCPSKSLEIYFTLIKHYETFELHDKKFEKDLFETFTFKDKQKLIQLIQDLCILDSDFFLDSAADYILGIFEENIMEWNDIQNYLGLENDFSQNERKLFENDEKLEYFLSINTKTFKFPFAKVKSLYSLKTDFLTPMNVLIARIVERSNERISYLLSLINKTIKNEVDRHPFKLTEFDGRSNGLYLDISFNCLPNKDYCRMFRYNLFCKTYKQKYFNALKNRKIIAEIYSIHFKEETPMKNSFGFFEYNSLKCPISETLEVAFSDTYKTIYQFDITKYYCSYINYKFCSFDEEEVDFGEIYNQLIAKDLSKEISLRSSDIFKFFSHSIPYKMYKKSNASKFYKFEIFYCRAKICQKFKEFVKNYMEDDGIIESSNAIPGIPIEIVKERGHYEYPVSMLKKYFEFME